MQAPQTEVTMCGTHINLLFCMFAPILGIRVLSTGRDVAAHKPHHSGAELLHSSLAGLDTVTVCARFNIYQFTYHGYGEWPDQVLLDTGEFYWFLYIGGMSEENNHYKKSAGKEWLNGEAKIVEFSNQVHLVDWKPESWNSICVVLCNSSKLWLNGEIIANDTSDIFRRAIKTKKNLSFMGNSREGLYHGEGYGFSLFGAMTDINIWNRNLTESEVEQWSRCELGAGGNLLDWTTAQWKAVDLQELDLDELEVCGKIEGKKHLVVPPQKKTFHAALDHCNSFGGRMAVAEDNKTSKEILNVVKPFLKKCVRPEVFSGYTDSKNEGTWLDINTEEILAWDSWFEGEPNDWNANEDCAVINLEKEKSFDIDCDTEYCSICRVQEMTAFHLRGACITTFIDRFYILKSPSRFLGYQQTTMFWAAENKRWEIVNMISNETAAYTNETSEIPIGLHHWYFTDQSGCTDPDKEFRTLKFNVRVEQPGKFFCDDGFRIDSEKVCDGNADCNFDEDETECDLVQIANYEYDADKPPKSYGKKEKVVLDLNVQTTIINMIEVNEEYSYFLIEFNQKVKWEDDNLMFVFLKSDPLKNLISQSDLARIWSPSPKFCCFSYGESPEMGVSRTFISKEGEPLVISDSDALRYNDSYSGAENPLYEEISLRAKFSCNFENYKNYPFGSETCQFMTYLPGNANNQTNLVAQSLQDLGRSSLEQFYRWSVEKGETAYPHVGLIYTLHLSRNMGSIILATYVPTLLMNLINQGTNYISSPDK